MSRRKNRVQLSSFKIACVKKYLASGLTQKAFCQREGLVYTTFQFWLRKYHTAQHHSSKTSPSRTRFIPLRVPSAPVVAHHTSFCTLEYPNGIFIHFSGTVDARLLSDLVQGRE
jgi:hypothetical protein